MGLISKKSGFSLVELMVTLVVAFLLVGIGVPSFNSAVKNSRLTSATNLLVTSLHLARTESIKRGRNVIMCAEDGNCNSEAWEKGWIIFVDEDENNERDADEELIFEQGNLKGTTIRGNNTIAESFGFSARGTPVGVGVAAGTFSICDDREDSGKAVIIAGSGRTRYDDDSQANCSS